MTWTVRWTPRALKDAKKLDPRTKSQVGKAIERFAEAGVGDIRHLTDVHPPEWRLRTGVWRIRFRKDSKATTLWILRILPRDKAY